MNRHQLLYSGSALRRILICVLLVLVSPYASAQVANQTPIQPPANWELDFDLFQTLLQTRGLRSVNGTLGGRWLRRWDQVFQDPSKAVVVFTGDLGHISDGRSLDRFLSLGGTVLVASNSPAFVRGFFRTDFGPATTTNPRQAWQGYEDCLIVADIEPHPLMDQVSTIVTNRSGWIAELAIFSRYEWSVLAKLPDDLKPATSIYMPLAAIATNQRSAGRIIVLADGSPLTNGMLWHGDNLKLLTNLVQELTRDDRTEFAFLNGQTPADSRIPAMLIEEALKSPPEIPPEIPPEALADLPADALLEIGNTLITSVEDSGVINELLVDRPRSLSDRFFRRSILLVIAAVALAVFVVRSWLISQSTLPWVQTRRHGDFAAPALDSSGMSYENAGRALARDVCRLLTGSSEPADWQSQLHPDSPVWRQLCSRSDAPQVTADTLHRVVSVVDPQTRQQWSRKDFEQFGNAIRNLKDLHRLPQPIQSSVAWT